jgi:hypothetical protein
MEFGEIDATPTPFPFTDLPDELQAETLSYLIDEIFSYGHFPVILKTEFNELNFPSPSTV